MWSYILTAVGISGFILAGRKVWWAWHINIACQGLWIAYAIVDLRRLLLRRMRRL